MTSHNHRSSYRQNDQMVCPACGKCWDINDRDEPECITEKQKGIQDEQRRSKRLTKKQSVVKGSRPPLIKGF